MQLSDVSYEYIPVVMGSDINPLGTVRAFRSLALPCLIVAEKEGIACHSKYVHRSFLNANILEALRAAGEYLAQYGKKGYLIPTSDAYALFLAKQGPLPPYHIVNECRETIEMCLDKTGLHALMEEAGLAYPKSYRVESARELETLKEAMFPLLVKPACTVGFVNHFEKAHLLEKPEDIAAYVASVEKAGLGHHALVAQEFIPGPPQNLVYYFAYSKNGEPLREGTSRKIRQYPPETGTATCVSYESIPDLFPVGRKINQLLHFSGFHGMEFKYDPRDGRYYLLDSNPRTYLSVGAMEHTGVNVVLAAYLDFIGEDISFIPEKMQTKVLWVKDYDDAIRAIYSNRLRYPAFAMNPFAYWKSRRGHVVFGIKDADDPTPLRYLRKKKVVSLVTRS